MGKIDLSSAVRCFSWVMRVFGKSLLKNDFHTKNYRVLSIFKRKRIILLVRKNLLF